MSYGRKRVVTPNILIFCDAGSSDRATRSFEAGSQCVGVSGAVVGGIRIGNAARRRDGCRIGDRTGRGGTDRAGGFVGDRARRRHSNGITDIPTATCSEAGSAAA